MDKEQSIRPRPQTISLFPSINSWGPERQQVPATSLGNSHSAPPSPSDISRKGGKWAVPMFIATLLKSDHDFAGVTQSPLNPLWAVPLSVELSDEECRGQLRALGSVWTRAKWTSEQRSPGRGVGPGPRAGD
ncbi:unnamed protein product [Boreogadus saida]